MEAALPLHAAVGIVRPVSRPRLLSYTDEKIKREFAGTPLSPQSLAETCSPQPSPSRAAGGASCSRSKEKFDSLLSSTFRELAGKASSSAARPDRRPASATRRENFMKEQYTLEIERGAGSEADHGGTARLRMGLQLDAIDHSGDGDRQNIRCLADSFRADCNSIEQMLEQGRQMDGLDSLESPSEATLRAEREAARKRRDEAERRARKKEQEARDPKRKVALKLENQRMFGDGEDDGTGKRRSSSIPMIFSEEVQLVDVKRLRARCRLADTGGASVSKLLDLSRQQERSGQLRSAAHASLGASASSPALFSQTAPCASSSSAPGLSGRLSPMRAAGWEERLERVQMQKQKQHIDTLIRKLNHMRIKVPERQRQQLVPRRNRHAEGDLMQVTLRPPGYGGAWPRTPEEPGPPDDRVESAASVRSGVRERARPAPKFAPLSEELRARARRRWQVVRAAVRLLLAWFRFMRVRRSIYVVRQCICHIGEWTRIKAASRRLVRSVVSVQRHYRAWLRSKRVNCEAISKIWQRTEDQHLVQYFKVFAKKIVQEIRHAEEKGNGSTLSIIKKQSAKTHPKKKTADNSNPENFVEEFLDWKVYRIPADERKKTINAFYLKQVRKHVWVHREILNAVDQTVQSAAELHDFLKDIGVDEPQTKDPCLEPASKELPHFWDVTEKTALELIAMTAQRLVNVEPFQEHPANKDLPKQVKTKLKLTRTMRAKSMLEESVVPLGRLSKKDPESTAWEAGRTASAAPRGDIDAVLRQFTPRLREIAEEGSVPNLGFAATRDLPTR